MKPKDKILTYAQARELKFFVDNCLGIRQEYYELLGSVTRFGEKIERLSKQGLLIEEFIRKNPGEMELPTATGPTVKTSPEAPLPDVR